MREVRRRRRWRAQRASATRSAGHAMGGQQAMHAWGVMDVLAVTDFPDIRTKCAIQSEARQHPAHPARGRLPVPHVRRPRRGRRRRPRRRPRDHRRRDHREGQRDPAPVHARRQRRRLAQRLRGRPPAHRAVRRRAGRGDRQAHAAGVHRRRRLPHAQRQGRSGHERLDAGRLQPRLEARPRAHRPQPRDSARHLLRRAAGGRPEASSTSTGSGRRSWRRSRRNCRPVGARGLLRDDRRVPGRVHDPVPAVDDRRRGRRTRRSPPGFPIGKRFKSAPVVRVADANPVHLGHHAPRRRPLARLRVRRRRRRRRGVRAARLGRVAGDRRTPPLPASPRPAPTSTPVRRQGRLPAVRQTRSTSARYRRSSCRAPARSGSSTTRRSTRPTRRRTSSTCAASTAAAA